MGADPLRQPQGELNPQRRELLTVSVVLAANGVLPRVARGSIETYHTNEALPLESIEHAKF